jgi:hypothetical protein
MSEDMGALPEIPKQGLHDAVGASPAVSLLAVLSDHAQVAWKLSS